MADSSKDLLHLESTNPSFTAIESRLLVCGTNNLKQVQNPKPKPPDGVPLTSSIPKSQVMGKVKNFLGILSEANKRLDNDAKDNANIEVLTGNESEYIEMDLMLGVADLNTPEAVAAAESAIAGNQPVISLATNESESESEDDDSSDDDDSIENDDDHKNKILSENINSRKRPKIVELP